MSNSKIAFTKAMMPKGFLYFKWLVTRKKRPAQLFGIFERLSIAQTIFEEEAVSNQFSALSGAMTLFCGTLKKLLDLSPEKLADMLDDYFEEKQNIDSNARLIVLLKITDTLVVPFFNALDIATQNDRTSNANEIVSHYLWNCLKLYFQPDTLTTIDSILKEENRSTFLKDLLFSQKNNFHKLRAQSKALFSSRYISFYNSCFFISKDVPLELMDFLNDLLFFIVESQLENKTLPQDLARWLPNALFINHKGELECLVCCTTTPAARKESLDLSAKANTLYTFDNMMQWKNAFDTFIVNNEIDLEACEKQYHFRAQDYASKAYRYYALQTVVFKIECFYYARQNYSAISQLWHARDDYNNAGVIYTGGSIHPETIDELLLMYWFFIYPNVIDETFYFGNPLSHVPHAKEYFILLLLRVLQKTEFPHFSKIKVVETYKLRDFIYSWNTELRISWKVPIEAVKNNSEALTILNSKKASFNITEQNNNQIQKNRIDTNHEELFKKLDAFSEKLCKDFQDEIDRREVEAPISESKIQEMKKEFWEGYYKNNGLLQKYLKPPFCRIEQPSDETSNSFGIYAFVPRDQFIDDTNIITNYADMGWQVALSENSKLFKILATECNPESRENWISVLNDMVKTQKDPIVFVTVRGRYDFLESQPQIGLDIISGNIFIKSDNERTQIEIHQIMMTPDDRQDKTMPFMLILEKDMIGALVYSNPLKKDDSIDNLFEHFKIKVTDARDKFRELEDANPLEESYLALGETPELRETYLKKQVILEITERFELETPDAFTGYAFYWEN